MQKICHILTIKETEVLDAMIVGALTIEETAKMLGIEIGSVHFHLTNIRKKYDTQSTTVAMIKYLKEFYDIKHN